MLSWHKQNIGLRLHGRILPRNRGFQKDGKKAPSDYAFTDITNADAAIAFCFLNPYLTGCFSAWVSEYRSFNSETYTFLRISLASPGTLD
jgi:hypothetical protein